MGYEMTKQPVILIVDDEKININILNGALKSDYKIQAAKNGEQALKRAEELAPDLILLDIMMPDMDGYDVCRQLKSNDKTEHIPIIFLTAVIEADYETKGLDMGAVDFITKPVNIPIVKARIKHHLERERYKNHLEELVEERTAELKNTKEELEIANKAKGDFLMNMSHELRTPLNGVVLAAELMADCKTGSEIEEIQEIIKISSSALLQTVEQILEFTKSKNGELELSELPFQLDQTLSKIKTNFFHKGKQQNLKPKFDIDPGCIVSGLIGDEKQLIEILNNLLENAAKFTTAPPKAVLKIETLEKSSEDVLLEFSLSDNGIGISKDNYDKIFEPFSQVESSSNRKYDGVGIGLSICRQLVTLMDGKICVESELGKGSRFYFTSRFKRQE